MHNKKLPKCHLAKYHWEVAAWEKAFGKVSSDYITEGDKVIFNRTNPLSKQLAI